MKTWDLFYATERAGFYPQQKTLPPGSVYHCHLIDLLEACEGPDDEELIRLRLTEMTEQEIGDALGVHQSTVSRRLFRIQEKAKYWAKVKAA